jgi:hypothetical protein
LEVVQPLPEFGKLLLLAALQVFLGFLVEATTSVTLGE